MNNLEIRIQPVLVSCAALSVQIPVLSTLLLLFTSKQSTLAGRHVL